MRNKQLPKYKIWHRTKTVYRKGSTNFSQTLKKDHPSP